MRFGHQMQIGLGAWLVKNPGFNIVHARAVCNCRLEVATALPVWAWVSSILFMACVEWRDIALVLTMRDMYTQCL